MSVMVERLAKRWAVWIGEHEDEPILRSDARWWLNAIADDLERRDTPLPLVRREMVIAYLRENDE